MRKLALAINAGPFDLHDKKAPAGKLDMMGSCSNNDPAGTTIIRAQQGRQIMKTFRNVTRLVGAITLSMASLSAAASYPDKPIKLLVGFPPGTATDTVARQIAQGLEKSKGWTIVVENKVGQAGSIAATDVARSAPDGYTILLSANGPLSTNPNLYSAIRYDPRKDLTAISRVAVLPYVLAVRTDSAFKNVQQLIDSGKKQPGKHTYASLGNGSTSHLISATFSKRTGADYLHVPYKGSAEIMFAVLSGDIDFIFDTSLATSPQIQSGKMRALAVSTKVPVPTLAGVQTLDALGVTDFDMAAWLGFVGPAGIPKDIVNTLQKAIQEVVSSPQMTENLKSMGALVSLMPADEFQKFLNTEYVKWGEALQQAGIPKQ